MFSQIIHLSKYNVSNIQYLHTLICIKSTKLKKKVLRKKRFLKTKVWEKILTYSFQTRSHVLRYTFGQKSLRHIVFLVTHIFFGLKYFNFECLRQFIKKVRKKMKFVEFSCFCFDFCCQIFSIGGSTE